MGFSHAKATTRKSKNFIKALQDSDGHWHVNGADLGNVLLQYFQNLFTTLQALIVTYLLT